MMPNNIRLAGMLEVQLIQELLPACPSINVKKRPNELAALKSSSLYQQYQIKLLPLSWIIK